MISPTLLQLIRRHEGVRASLYQDSLGYWTLGVGHLVDKRKGLWCDDELAKKLQANGYRLSENVINAYLEDDLSCAQMTVEARLAPILERLNTARYEALVSMAFNLGRRGFSSFEIMLAAILKEDWQGAHDAALDSKWARQLPQRAQEIATVLLCGDATNHPR
jgi:lysozyme